MADEVTCRMLEGTRDLPDMSFKSILLGEAGVGKTCLFLRATRNDFTGAYEVTLGTEHGALDFDVQSKIVQLQLWDTAGQETFRSMVKVFYKGSHAVFLVYSIANRKSFESLEAWLKEVREATSPDVLIFLVGNQKDREDMREVSTDAGREFTHKHDLAGFIETSAKTGERVRDLLLFTAKTLYLRNQQLYGLVKPQHVDFTLQAPSSTKSKSKSRSGCC
jgi:Ras-related protein Rab-2A